MTVNRQEDAFLVVVDDFRLLILRQLMTRDG